MNGIVDVPADLRPVKGRSLPDRTYVTIPEIAKYYGLTYPRMWRRIFMWGVPIVNVSPKLNLIDREVALNLRKFRPKNGR